MYLSVCMREVHPPAAQLGCECSPISLYEREPAATLVPLGETLNDQCSEANTKCYL